MSTSTLWPQNLDWQAYVPSATFAADGKTALPVRVVRTSGCVLGAESILAGAGASSVLMLKKASDADQNPYVVLDYGANVGGQPVIEFAGVSGAEEALVTRAYSESVYWLEEGREGDTPARHSADYQRVNTYRVTGGRKITNLYVQGGQRYEKIELTTVGTVSIASVGILSRIYDAGCDAWEGYRGHFLCSDEALNKIWYLSSYTVQLNSLPAGETYAPNGLWASDGEALVCTGDENNAGLIPGGFAWHDYTAEFEVRLDDEGLAQRGNPFVGAAESGEPGIPRATWVMRSDNDNHGVHVELTAATEEDEGTLVVYGAGSERVELAHAEVDKPADTWIAVKTSIIGDTLTVWLDGAQVAEVYVGKARAEANGTFAIWQHADYKVKPAGENASYRNLKITGVDGSVLYQHAFDQPGQNYLAYPFANNTEDVIVDGGRRDRSVWTGDLPTQAPTVYASTFATSYVKGSLRQLGSHLDSLGRVSTNLNAELRPNTSIGVSDRAAVYSANYTLWWVEDLADYYLHTGDMPFIREMWSAVESELAWAATQVDETGLFATFEDELGRDWDWYNGPKVGHVTAYNALYYACLRDMAAIAREVGKDEEAEAWAAAAKAVKCAVNELLFNEETGVYGISDQLRGCYAQDGNALAVMFGVAEGERAASVMARLKEVLWMDNGPRAYVGAFEGSENISPMLSGYELSARFNAENGADALDLIRRVWTPMIDEQGPWYSGTAWEVLDYESKPGLADFQLNSLSHGWGTMPCPGLSSGVLGVKPVTAGFREWLVKPVCGDLEWAQGTVPTPAGGIDVAWGRSGDGSALELDVTAPAGTTGTVAIPLEGFADGVSVAVNDATVWTNGETSVLGAPYSPERQGSYLYLHGIEGGRACRVAVTSH